jgi:uncharacterized protein (TIGR03435 family)
MSTRAQSRNPYLAVCLATILVVPAAVGAQAQPSAAAVQSATEGPAVPKLAFEVVSIRRNTSGTREMTRQSASNTDNITMTNVPLALVVLYAYWINDPNMVAGLPDWAWSERYDVVAKVAPSDLPAYHALDKTQRPAMLQSVLAERFRLQTHHEIKDRPVYALVIAKGGSKLKEAQPGEAHPNADKANPNGMSHGSTIFATGPGQITGEAATMRDLALTLSDRGEQSLGRPVIDKTGLTGKYDFTLQLPPTISGDDAQQSVAALFTAVQEQLGLKLQPATSSTDYLVIDHIERPSAN